MVLLKLLPVGGLLTYMSAELTDRALRVDPLILCFSFYGATTSPLTITWSPHRMCSVYHIPSILLHDPPTTHRTYRLLALLFWLHSLHSFYKKSTRRPGFLKNRVGRVGSFLVLTTAKETRILRFSLPIH